MNTPTAISFAGVCKAYGSTKAVDGVSFDIEPGSFVAVLGPSGAGKTTLMRILTGMVRPEAGQVRIGDDALTALNGKASRSPARCANSRRCCWPTSRWPAWTCSSPSG